MVLFGHDYRPGESASVFDRSDCAHGFFLQMSRIGRERRLKSPSKD